MPDFHLTFLGTGTSQGVPMIGCFCPVCASADPRDKRSRASIYVQTPECAFVVDTGPDFRSQCLRERVGRVDAVLLSHSHTDHIMGFDDLRRFSDLRRVDNLGGLPVFAAPEHMEDLQRVFAFAFNPKFRFPGYLHVVPHVIEKPFRLGETTVTPLPVPHGFMDVTGFLFARGKRKLLAYFSDAKAIPEPVREAVRGVEVLVVDALRHKPHPTHMSLDEALETAAAIEPAQTLLTHLCHDLSHVETEKTLPAGVRVAYDGLRLELGK
ncbi:MAG: MBL fold metallo-hydrolase [Verrucomicrobia bacterium]|nr:MBL fold metallo-hydrolase [Verrucomicrobiota bacterium]